MEKDICIVTWAWFELAKGLNFEKVLLNPNYSVRYVIRIYGSDCEVAIAHVQLCRRGIREKGARV